jgi:uncharacterized protein
MAASPRDEVLAALRRRAEEVLGEGDESDRGWRHTERVYGLARKLAREEEADRFVVGAAALLHDWGRLDAGPEGDHAARAAKRAAAELTAHALPETTIAAIVATVAAGAADGDGDGATPPDLEARVLADARRLDLLGAFGIARALAAGAAGERPLHERTDPFALMRELEPGRYAIDDLFARLLDLPGRLHTPTARAIASRRVALVAFFLEGLRAELAETLPDSLLPEGDWLIPEEGAPGGRGS